MKLEKLIIGGFVYFVEEGDVIDTTTVGIAAYPDVDPIENWENMGNVSEVNFDKETETDTDYDPSPAGGYDKINDETVVADIIKFITKQMSEPVWRMKLGLKNKIVDGVAQTPFNEKRRKIRGWLKVQGRGNDGSDRVIMNVYGDISLDANPKWSKDPTKPGLKFQKVYSPISTVEPNGIV